jgi:ribosome biogenesis protein UTP30
MAAKAASKSTTKVVKKASSQTKAKLEKEHDGLLKIGVDPSLVARAVAALLEHHKKTSDEKNSLLGNDRPVQVQFTLLRTPEKSSPKPIRVLVPHPLFKLADKDDGGDDSTEEPEICLIVKEESKPWCQEMIERFPEHMGCIKKVLGLQSLRKKHAQYAQRRELLNKYNVFMADDRILPMLTKALGKDFIKAKKQPVPINLTRKEALPFTIQKALSATYMTLSSGTCVMVK